MQGAEQIDKGKLDQRPDIFFFLFSPVPPAGRVVIFTGGQRKWTGLDKTPLTRTRDLAIGGKPKTPPRPQDPQEQFIYSQIKYFPGESGNPGKRLGLSELLRTLSCVGSGLVWSRACSTSRFFNGVFTQEKRTENCGVSWVGCWTGRERSICVFILYLLYLPLSSIRRVTDPDAV